MRQPDRRPYREGSRGGGAVVFPKNFPPVDSFAEGEGTHACLRTGTKAALPRGYPGGELRPEERRCVLQCRHALLEGPPFPSASRLPSRRTCAWKLLNRRSVSHRGLIECPQSDGLAAESALRASLSGRDTTSHPWTQSCG